MVVCVLWGNRFNCYMFKSSSWYLKTEKTDKCLKICFKCCALFFTSILIHKTQTKQRKINNSHVGLIIWQKQELFSCYVRITFKYLKYLVVLFSSRSNDDTFPKKTSSMCEMVSSVSVSCFHSEFVDKHSAVTGISLYRCDCSKCEKLIGASWTVCLPFLLFLYWNAQNVCPSCDYVKC